MDGLRITLFGQFHVHRNAETLANLKNRKLKKLVPDLSLDKHILQEVLAKKV